MFCRVNMQRCEINGKIRTAIKEDFATWQAHNRMKEPAHHIGVPPEEGAFEFVPNQYTRKQ